MHHILVAYEICIMIGIQIYIIYINIKSKVLSYASFKLIVKFNFACF